MLTHITSRKGENRWEAARAITAIMFAILVNDCERFGDAGGKNKDNDYEVFCQLVKQHSVNDPKNGKCQLLTID